MKVVRGVCIEQLEIQYRESSKSLSFLNILHKEKNKMTRIYKSYPQPQFI